MTASTAEALVAHHGSVEGLVVRTRLLRVFDAESRTLIGALVAPSGYGKTTLLRQWVSQEARPVAWLALRPEHGAAVRLLNAITAGWRPFSMTRMPKSRSCSCSTTPS